MNKIYPDSVIVDENDQVIGRMQLPEAIKQGYNLRVARVTVINTAGEMLLQQRGRKIMAPLLWNDAAAGHVDVGEGYLSTAVRELAEEAGITTNEADLEKIDYQFVREGRDSRITGRFHTAYRYRYTSDTEIVPLDDEVEAFRWITLDELERELDSTPELFTEGFIRIARNYLKNYSNR